MVDIDKLISTARFSGDKISLLVYQALKNEILTYKTAKNAKPYDDASELRIIKKMVKQREDSREQYLQAHREDLAANEGVELEVLKKLLPEPVNESQLCSELADWCQLENFYIENPSSDIPEIILQIPKKEMGKAIKHLKSKFPAADGKMISEIVKQNLV